MIIGQKKFDVRSRTYTTGILNTVPDSFSDGGRYCDREMALRQAEKLVFDGADIIGVGGESTRPGYRSVGEEEELERVPSVIRLTHENFDVSISVDTCENGVAWQAMEAGAAMANGIWGLKKDKDMVGTIAKLGVCCCLMHNRQDPIERHSMSTTLEEMSETILLAEQAGTRDGRIVLGPDVGFGKTYKVNLEVTRSLSVSKCFGYPVLPRVPRKSVISLALDLPVDKREEGALVMTATAVFFDCSFVRIHNVEGNRGAIRMARLIMGAPEFK